MGENGYGSISSYTNKLYGGLVYIYITIMQILANLFSKSGSVEYRNFSIAMSMQLPLTEIMVCE